MNRSLLFILITALLISFSSCNSRSGKRVSGNTDKYGINSNNQSENQKGYYSVSKIVDGDTFRVYDGTKKGLAIRLIGVDTPETRKSAHKEIGYFGEEAKQYLSSLLTGKKIKLVYDVNQFDRYQRTLAYVYLEDGTFVNAELVKNGFAMVMTIPPNVKFADEFARLQQEAREYNRGLWKSQNRSMDKIDQHRNRETTDLQK